MNRKNKFACGIVTYFPNNDVIDKINKYSDEFDEVYVFDNTPQESDVLKKLELNQKIHLYSNEENNGLSVAYNYFVKEAISNCDFLCTLDQDSVFLTENIEKIIDYINSNDLDSIAVIGPKIIYNNDYEMSARNSDINDKRYLISSGSFLNLSILKENNIKFDPQYFIDRVDIDFCQECIRKGFRVVEYTSSVLYQTLGTPTKHMNKGNHSYKRHYYMFRNRFYYNRKFSNSLLQRESLNIIQSLKQCLRILTFEDQKINKLKQLLLAIYDYQHNIMGSGRY
ncbi:glycosyltransferase [Limosilactobacillus reuteri subsp. suis]|uniref:glycosyltransferase n=1 Tax=Limosilactobacillus reuteri TaxID=1598 RepID=UPI003995D905